MHGRVFLHQSPVMSRVRAPSTSTDEQLSTIHRINSISKDEENDIFTSEDSDSDLDEEEMERKFLSAAREGHDFVIIELLNVASSLRLNINCKGKVKGQKGWTPLHFASYFGHIKVLELLLNANADVNIQNNTGDTPLHKAALTGRDDAVDILLKNGADTRIKNVAGELPSTLAQSKHLKQMLLNTMQSQEHQNEKKLLQAAMDGDLNTAAALMKTSSLLNINCVDELGNTPLHCAANRGHEGVVVGLLQSGADTNLRNNNGKTAAEIANTDRLRTLLQHLSTAVYMQGMLFRFSSVLRRWRKRAVVLRKGRLRFYTPTTDNAFADLIDVIEVTHDSVITVSDKSPLEFGIETPTTKLRLRAESDEDRGRWIATFKACSGTIRIVGNTQVRTHPHAHKDSQNISLPELLTTANKLRTYIVDSLNEMEANALRQPISEERTLVMNVTKQFELPLRQMHTLITSLQTTANMLAQKEKMWAHELQREREARGILEESLRVLAAQHNDLENIAGKDHALLEGAERDGEDFFDAVSMIFIEDECRPVIPGPAPRTTLPSVEVDRNALSLWSVLNQFVGKDLTKISMPVMWNEPLSLLQRLSEDFEYHALLHAAARIGTGGRPPVAAISHIDSAHTQMLYVAAFAASTYSSTSNRTDKPFNPLLGETFDLIVGDTRVMCEQVSHHPPISGIHAEADEFEFWGWSDVKTKFWGKSMEFLQKGGQHLRFTGADGIQGNHFTWNKITTSVHNIIIGKLWLENHGVMKIINHTTGDTCELDFKQSGWFNKNAFCVEGKVMNAKGESVYHISGKWNEALWAWPDTSMTVANSPPKSAICIWKRHPPHPNNEAMYHMTSFAVTLNELPPDASVLARTDTRLRPDQRLLENGEVQKAADEKQRLEEKQRAARKRRVESGEVYTPAWFQESYDNEFNTTGYMPTRKYWKERNDKSTTWADIF
eukprot:CFRG7888T1